MNELSHREAQYDAFLVTALCEDDEISLTVLSLLARQDFDPRQEAARLAQLYAETLSRLHPRVMVEGNQAFLQQAARQNDIRALLLAAVRAAVLWRQLGGTQWRLLFRRKQYSMLARGLLARCTLDGS